MIHERLLEIHDGICASARGLMDRKNSDYCPADNALRSLKEFGSLGILVRLYDKLSRLRTLLEGGKHPAVTNETEHDTLLDAINYLVLYRALKEEEHGVQVAISSEVKEAIANADNAQNKAAFGVPPNK